MNSAAKSTATTTAPARGAADLRSTVRDLADHLVGEIVPSAQRSQAMELVTKRIGELSDRDLHGLTRAMVASVDSAPAAPLDALVRVARTVVEGFAGWFAGSLMMGPIRAHIMDLGTQQASVLWRSVQADTELLRPLVNGAE